MKQALRVKGFSSIAALTAMATAFLVGFPTAAYATACYNGGGWCNGSDGNTRYNIGGSDPQIYSGEVGVYYVQFGGGTGPCPSDAYQSCFNTSAANGAQSRYNAGTGLGTQFYYLAGGASSQYEAQYGSPYCWGWRQGYAAVHHAADTYSTYYNTAWLMAIDVEGPGLGWNTDTYNDRQTFNGFVDYLEGLASADPANCNYVNHVVLYQPMVYSAPSQWGTSFGSYGSIPTIPEWTSQICCHAQSPGDFYYSSSEYAQWFGGVGSAEQDEWQFDQNPDYDIAHEPLYLPFFGLYLGS